MSQLRFNHHHTALLPVHVTPLQAWNLIMSKPLPLMHTAFRVRDAVSRQFGVRKIGGFSGVSRNEVAVGDRLDFFLVEHSGPNLLVLSERDRHLDVVTRIASSGRQLTIASTVVTHNAFGRAYMLVVGPTHRLIVRAMMSRLIRLLRENPDLT